MLSKLKIGDMYDTRKALGIISSMDISGRDYRWMRKILSSMSYRHVLESITIIDPLAIKRNYEGV